MTTQIAYFSMEVGLRVDLPCYSGGLGVLAGDTIKSCADLGLPVVGVTMLYRRGYFRQSINQQGRQQEAPVVWNIEDIMQPVSPTVTVSIAGRKVEVRAWRYQVKGYDGGIVPVYFLDTDCASNSDEDRSLSATLYGGDGRYRLMQEIVLGQGGVKMLQALGYDLEKTTFHMNEGHAALLTAELLHQFDRNVEKVKDHCVFTTHTPVAAGHDRFDASLAKELLSAETWENLLQIGLINGVDQLNMTNLAINQSRYINGVAKRHGEVSRQMFPNYEIDSITNGIHVNTWVAPEMSAYFDEVAPGWRSDSMRLRQVWDAPLAPLEAAHGQAKRRLLHEVNQMGYGNWDLDVFTIGFARRAATYKRANLLFWDIEQLKEVSEKHGGLQLIFAGKAHPADEGGKRLIQEVVAAKEKLKGSNIKLVYLENYDMALGHLLVGGVDVWLNNPVKPMEASGTSGMKAALNGIPSLSTLDGWWVEGCIEGVTGWEIEDCEDALQAGSEEGKLSEQAARNLYKKLDQEVLPTYYKNRSAYTSIRRNAISINGSYFHTQRMVEQYLKSAWKMRES